MHNPLEQAIHTPVHLFYRSRVWDDAKALQMSLSRYLPRSEFLYSVKTNPLPELLGLLNSSGWKMEAISPGDLEATKAAKIDAASITLSGAAWTRKFLLSALNEFQIQNFIVDSLEMGILLSSVFREINATTKYRVGFRLNDGNSHFGILPHKDQIQKLAGYFSGCKISEYALHIHRNVERSVTGVEPAIQDFQDRILKLSQAKILFEEVIGEKISILNLGGGLESPFVYILSSSEVGTYHTPSQAPQFHHLADRPRFSLHDFASSLGERISEALEKFDLGNCTIQFELGRSVATRALSTLLGVVSTKDDLYPNCRVVVCDGNTAALGPIHRAIHPIRIGNEAALERTSHFIYGNLPHSGDWLYQNINLPQLNVGDRFLIEHTGAYYLPLEARFGCSLPAIYDVEKEKYLRESTN